MSRSSKTPIRHHIAHTVRHGFYTSHRSRGRQTGVAPSNPGPTPRINCAPTYTAPRPPCEFPNTLAIRCSAPAVPGSPQNAHAPGTPRQAVSPCLHPYALQSSVATKFLNFFFDAASTTFYYTVQECGLQSHPAKYAASMYNADMCRGPSPAVGRLPAGLQNVSPLHALTGNAHALQHLFPLEPMPGMPPHRQLTKPHESPRKLLRKVYETSQPPQPQRHGKVRKGLESKKIIFSRASGPADGAGVAEKSDGLRH